MTSGRSPGQLRSWRQDGKTVVMVGTRKGLWMGTSDDAREDWEFTGPHHDMEEVYSCMVDTRTLAAAALRGRVVELAGPAGALVRRPRRDLAGDPGRRDPVPRRRRRVGRADLAARPRATSADELWAGTEPGAVWRSTRPRRRASSWSAASGTTRTARSGAPGFGGQAFHTMLPHPDDAGLGDGGDLDRRRLPDRRRRRLVGAAQPRASGPSSCPRASSTRSSASACTRSPGTRRGPSGSTCRTTAASTAPTTTAATWDYIGDGLPSDFGFAIVVHPARAGHDLRVPDRRRRRPLPAGRQGPGVAVARRRRHLGGARQRTARRLLRRGDARRDVRTTATTRLGLYVGARNGAVWASADAGESWRQIVANLPDVLVVRAAALPDRDWSMMRP